MQQVCRFMHRILQVHQRKMLYLNFPRDSVGHCIRHAIIKVLSEPNFSAYGQNPMTYTGKCVSEKTPTYTSFTQCDVFNPLSAKLTKWQNTLKQFVGNLPTKCLSVFGHFTGLAIKGLNY